MIILFISQPLLVLNTNLLENKPENSIKIGQEAIGYKIPNVIKQISNKHAV